MNTRMVRKNWWIAVLALLLVAFAVAPLSSARAAEGDGTFKVTVNHGINGKSLSNDLPKALPVDVVIWQNGAYLTTLENFEFKDSFRTNLPAGTYDIFVYLDQSLGGTLIPSMTIRGAAIPEGVDVRLNATLGAGKTPEIRVKIK
jgi:hypothetical protein